MKFAAFALIAALVPSLASAATLTYKIDFAKSEIDAETAFEICGLPKFLSMDAKEDLATVVINRTQTTDPGAIRTQYIQATSGAISGGGLQEPYMGDYRVRVGLVSTKAPVYSSSPLVTRVEVVTYGSPKAPKAFTVHTELLNFRDSAEFAESSVCTGYAYRLQ